MKTLLNNFKILKSDLMKTKIETFKTFKSDMLKTLMKSGSAWSDTSPKISTTSESVNNKKSNNIN